MTITLDNETLESFKNDLNKIQKETMDKIGKKDAKYIKKVISVQRFTDTPHG